MKEITLDASTWRLREDFFDALLPAIGAPAWHGRNLDALAESFGEDDILAIRGPLQIKITNSRSAPSELRDYLAKFEDMMTDLRKDHDHGPVPLR